MTAPARERRATENDPPATGNALLLRSLRRHPGAVVFGVLFMSTWQICETLVPVAIGLIIDHAVIPKNLTALAWSIIGLALLFVVLSFGYRFGARAFQNVREEESHAMRVEVADAALATESRSERAPGEVLSLASADVTAEVFFHIGRGSAALLGLLVAAVYLFVADPLTGLVVAIGVPLSLVAVSLPSRAITARSTAQQEAIGAAGRSASDLMQGIGVLKSLGGERWALGRYRTLSRKAAAAGIATGSRSGLLEGIGALTMMAVLAAVILTAGLRVTSGGMGIGTFVAVLGVAAFFTEPMQSLAQIIGALARSRGAAARIADYLAEARARGATAPAPGAEPPTPQAPRGHVDSSSVEASEASGLRVSLPPLDDVGPLEFHAPRGALTAMVTQKPSDAARVIAALAESGSHEMIVAPHDVDLFEGTVRSNIALDHDADVEIDEQVLRASGVADIVELLPGGLDHRIQDLGTNLSGGQRQRVALARALAADPNVLVLHDPTTAVDAVTEAAIANEISELRRGRCTLVLTSSPAFLAAAETVVFVEEGTSAVIGDHSQLAENSQAYREAVSR